MWIFVMCVLIWLLGASAFWIVYLIQMVSHSVHWTYYSCTCIWIVIELKAWGHRNHKGINHEGVKSMRELEAWGHWKHEGVESMRVLEAWGRWKHEGVGNQTCHALYLIKALSTYMFLKHEKDIFWWIIWQFVFFRLGLTSSFDLQTIQLHKDP